MPTNVNPRYIKSKTVKTRALVYIETHRDSTMGVFSSFQIENYSEQGMMPPEPQCHCKRLLQ